MGEQIVDLSSRHEGCRAVFKDDGREILIPVCMGGIVLAGCNNYEQCKEPYRQRTYNPPPIKVLDKLANEIRATAEKEA